MSNLASQTEAKHELTQLFSSLRVKKKYGKIRKKLVHDVTPYMNDV